MGGIGIGTGPAAAVAGGESTITTSLSNDTTTPVSKRNLKCEFTFYGTQHLDKNAIFMTIISALVNAAPPLSYTPVRKTWSSFLHDQPVVFIVVPDPTATSPHFTYEDLILSVSRAADYFVWKNEYRPLRMSINVSDVKVAEGAIVPKASVGSVGFDWTGEGDLIASI